MSPKEEGTIVKNTRGRGRGRTANGNPNPVDIHVGARVRLRRTLLGMSQEKLGEAIGLTFQQVQKYERGANRVGASRLYDLSRVLEVPVSFFFDDMPDEIASKSVHQRREMSESPDPFDNDPMNRRETLELVRAYYRITDPNQRKKIFELVKSMGAIASGDADQK
ncbi:helix-turn-helix domain-containing protein [Thalassospira lucentensis]|uniref:helix-turn-helix domain-containing protein n=1 Tax=Thalassospira lucentensis TaxID=168935 RepID=UPI00142D5A82|nr:helix-turn-helix domain-containing protein [Thalassospira lucentensis]NIZ00835.1 helix-turn-helix domain-containing protein [Thalassospira lucentensis]